LNQGFLNQGNHTALEIHQLLLSKHLPSSGNNVPLIPKKKKKETPADHALTLFHLKGLLS